MAGLKLVLSTHASLSPVCKAPVSTSALYQPLFVRQAESHTSNNLTSHQFSPSGHVKAVVMEREPSASLSFVALIWETNIYSTCFKGSLSAIHFVFAKLKAGAHHQARGVFRKVFRWANKERYMCGSEWVRAGSLVCESRLDEFQRSSRASGQIGYWSCLSTDFSKYLSVLCPARAWPGIHIVSSICISCL